MSEEITTVSFGIAIEVTQSLLHFSLSYSLHPQNNYLCVAVSNGLFVLAYYEEQIDSLDHIDEHVCRIIETKLDSRAAKVRAPTKVK